MRKMLIVLLSVAVCSCLALATVSTTNTDWDHHIVPAGVDTAGGPDAYGYTWKDSMEPGGPRFQWIDIEPTGTLVTGLGDDNYVGAFPIGFSFEYYWYPVTELWIGSNGYLKFGSGALMASPFPASIPLPALPNDFIAVYVADWVLGSPTAPDSCLIWTNNVDTCIVSWINIQTWQPTGNSGSHTFQVILARTDSSITFQLGTQQVDPYSASGNWSLSGIECANGQVGLQRAANMLMPANYAVKFYYPDNVTYQAHDLAAQQAANATSEGFFLEVGSSYTPTAVVKNVGNQNETSYTARFRIQQTGGSVVYDQTVNGGAIAAGEEQAINYSQSWTPTVTAQYVMMLNVTLAGDINPYNDQKRVECHALTLPGTLLYDDGGAELGLSWQGGGTGNEGAAARFVPPTYPVRIDSIRIFASAASAPFRAQIRDDNGPGGIPGDTLYTQDITVGAAGWYGANITPQNVQIDSGAFYVVWLMLSSTAQLGEDSTLIASRQAWEYTGVWSPYRSGETSDLMIRAKISAVGPPNQPPQINSYYPTDLDTVAQGDAVDFGVSATDPDGDPLTYLWKLDNTVQGTDSVVTIVFDSLGSHVVWVWVSDGELADSMNWPVTVVPVGVMDNPARIPTDYALNAAHPNPFNPTTTISFSLPRAGDVRLAVYDQAGREIARLVGGWRAAGTHQVVFNATGLASGIYIVKLDSGTFSASQKIVMMK